MQKHDVLPVYTSRLKHVACMFFLHRRTVCDSLGVLDVKKFDNHCSVAQRTRLNQFWAPQTIFVS